MKKKSINRKFSNSSLRQSKNKMMGGADAGTSASKKNHFDIPAGTTEITEESWEEWKVDKRDLSSVTIPDSVKTIKKNAFKSAFYNSDNRPEVTIPDSVTKIEEKAFEECSISVITILGTTEIKSCAFYYCRYLREVNIQYNYYYDIFGEGVFYGCIGLETINFGPIERDDEDDEDDDEDIDKLANNIQELNGFERTVLVKHYLGEDDDNCLLKYTWEASTNEVKEMDHEHDSGLDCKSLAKYEGNERNEYYDVVDGSGIISPIILQDLGGNFFPVTGFFNNSRNIFKDIAVKSAKVRLVIAELNLKFKKEHYEIEEAQMVFDAAKKDFDQLKEKDRGNNYKWDFTLPNLKEGEKALDDVFVVEVINSLVDGDYTLDGIWTLVWKEGSEASTSGKSTRRRASKRKGKDSKKKRKPSVGKVSGKKEKKKKQSNRKGKRNPLLGRRSTEKKKGKPSPSKKKGINGSKSKTKST